MMGEGVEGVKGVYAGVYTGAGVFGFGVEAGLGSSTPLLRKTHIDMCVKHT